MVKVYGADNEIEAFYTLDRHLKSLTSADLESLRAELNATSLYDGQPVRLGDVQSILSLAAGVVQTGEGRRRGNVLRLQIREEIKALERRRKWAGAAPPWQLIGAHVHPAPHPPCTVGISSVQVTQVIAFTLGSNEQARTVGACKVWGRCVSNTYDAEAAMTCTKWASSGKREPDLTVG